MEAILQYFPLSHYFPLLLSPPISILNNTVFTEYFFPAEQALSME